MHDWSPTLAYGVALLVSGVVMKTLSAASANAPSRERAWFFVLSPVPSFDSWRIQPANAREATHLAVTAALAAVGFAAALLAIRPLDMHWFARGYLAVVPFWLLTEAIGRGIKLAYMPFGVSLALIHRTPWRARSLAEFWGSRWNSWVRDWLHEIIYRRYRRQPMKGLWLTFAASGLFHEVLISVPTYITTKLPLFGAMTGYFLLQAAGITIERRCLRRSPGVRRAFLFSIVLLPVPLVLNQGTQWVFHLVE